MSKELFGERESSWELLIAQQFHECDQNLARFTRNVNPPTWVPPKKKILTPPKNTILSKSYDGTMNSSQTKREHDRRQIVIVKQSRRISNKQSLGHSYLSGPRSRNL